MLHLYADDVSDDDSRHDDPSCSEDLSGHLRIQAANNTIKMVYNPGSNSRVHI